MRAAGVADPAAQSPSQTNPLECAVPQPIQMLNAGRGQSEARIRGCLQQDRQHALQGDAYLVPRLTSARSALGTRSDVWYTERCIGTKRNLLDCGVQKLAGTTKSLLLLMS